MIDYLIFFRDSLCNMFSILTTSDLYDKNNKHFSNGSSTTSSIFLMSPPASSYIVE